MRYEPVQVTYSDEGQSNRDLILEGRRNNQTNRKNQGSRDLILSSHVSKKYWAKKLQVENNETNPRQETLRISGHYGSGTKWSKRHPQSQDQVKKWGTDRVVMDSVVEIRNGNGKRHQKVSRREFFIFFFLEEGKRKRPPGTYVPSGVLRKTKLASERSGQGDAKMAAEKKLTTGESLSPSTIQSLFFALVFEGRLDFYLGGMVITWEFTTERQRAKQACKLTVYVERWSSIPQIKWCQRRPYSTIEVPT